MKNPMQKNQLMEVNDMKSLLSLSKSDRECKYMRYVGFKASDTVLRQAIRFPEHV